MRVLENWLLHQSNIELLTPSMCQFNKLSVVIVKSLAAFFRVVFVVYLSLDVVSPYTKKVKNLERQLNKIPDFFNRGSRCTFDEMALRNCIRTLCVCRSNGD
jgi:hypothetical protein